MKKNKVFLLGLITVFVAVLSLSLVSGTYAKYTSKVSGTSTAHVATWAFKVDGSSIDVGHQDASFTVSLFDTIVADANVVDTSTIAPGTKGSMALSVVNESEVSARVDYKFEFDFSALTDYAALQASFDNLPASEADFKAAVVSHFKFSCAELVLSQSGATYTASKDLKFANAANDDECSATLSWEWVFEAPAEASEPAKVQWDAVDTAIQSITDLIKVNVSITFTQID